MTQVLYDDLPPRPGHDDGVDHAANGFLNIRRAKNEWQATADSLRQIILLVDSEGRVLRANLTLERWGLGSVREVQGRFFHEIFHSGCTNPVCYLALLWSEARCRLLQGENCSYLIPDQQLGRNLWIEFLPLCAGRGEHRDQFAVVSVEDRSHCLEMESRLYQTSAELKAVFSAMSLFYLRVDAAGVVTACQNGRDHSLVDSLGIAPGKHLDEIFPQPVAELYSETCRRLGRSHGIERIRYKLIRPWGEQIFEVHLMAFPEEQFLVIGRDITEHVRLESIAHSVDLMNNLGSIFCGIRHEIGNPVNSIKLTMSVLKNNLDKYPREMVVEYIERVLGEVERIEYLLRALKSFNMYEDQKPETVVLGPFLTKFLDLVRKDCQLKSIRIHGVGLEENLRSHLDPRALWQILINIVNNSMDAVQRAGGGEIEIRLSGAAGIAQIVVRDSGVGMTPPQLKQIFQPFFTTKPSGTGLGLVMVKKLLVQMGGDIDVQSTTLLGTTVTLTLPREK